MERLPLVMIRRNMASLPQFDIPGGYKFRLFHPGDEILWAEVEHAAGEFATTMDALVQFQGEFGQHLTEMRDRCFFVETDEDRVIGTGTAWYDHSFMGEDFGRLHWIGIRPEFQRRGLGKALVSRLMERLSESHDKAYLTTQTTSVAAVKIYLDFGFVPLIRCSEDLRAWTMIYEATQHPALALFVQQPERVRPE